MAFFATYFLEAPVLRAVAVFARGNFLAFLAALYLRCAKALDTMGPAQIWPSSAGASGVS
jgi:hypothetical protein